MELKTRRGRGESVNSKFREDLLALLPFPTEESAKNASEGISPNFMAVWRICNGCVV